MTPETLFEAWAPTGSCWTTWTKPVLFSCLPVTVLPEPPPTPVGAERALAEVPLATGDLAFILDLPGAEGVFAALALARRGYRPVPLYNTVPLPSEEWPSGSAPIARVEVLPLLATLVRFVPALLACPLPSDAPPAFLLDANRRTGSRPANPSAFDNRSVCFTTDFPSANFLLAQGIRRVWLVQSTAIPPQADLAHILRAWQAAGIALWTKSLTSTALAVPLVVRKPSWLHALGHGLLVLLGLREDPLGGFSGMLSAPAARHTNRPAQSAG